jgi:hypothetical protein
MWFSHDDGLVFTESLNYESTIWWTLQVVESLKIDSIDIK